MARPVRIRLSYTGERSRLTRLEEAVQKDPRLSGEKKSEIAGLIQRLVIVLMDLDRQLPPVLPAELVPRVRTR